MFRCASCCGSILKSYFISNLLVVVHSTSRFSAAAVLVVLSLLAVDVDFCLIGCTSSMLEMTQSTVS